jgi:hypothetical protein
MQFNEGDMQAEDNVGELRDEGVERAEVIFRGFLRSAWACSNNVPQYLVSGAGGWTYIVVEHNYLLSRLVLYRIIICVVGMKHVQCAAFELTCLRSILTSIVAQVYDVCVVTMLCSFAYRSAFSASGMRRLRLCHILPNNVSLNLEEHRRVNALRFRGLSCIKSDMLLEIPINSGGI